MIKFKPYSSIDNQVFKCEAFSMLVPEGWTVTGGVQWRQHATMPGTINLSVRSPDDLHELNILPSTPYYWDSSPMSFFPPTEGSYYMGNEVRRPVSGYLQYVQQYILPKSGFAMRITSSRKSVELENALRSENGGGFGCSVVIDGGIASLEYEHRGYLFEGNISCGIAITNMIYGKTSWIADKIISTRTPKGQLKETVKVFSAMLNSFRFNIRWFSCYHELVRTLTQYVLQDIYNAGLISRIISTTYNHISDTARRSYENQQATYSKVFKGISEGTRGVNSFYDPHKGYEVEFPVDYRYVYANSLGEYIVTDNPNYNPNINSNLNWTILNRA